MELGPHGEFSNGQADGLMQIKIAFGNFQFNMFFSQKLAEIITELECKIGT